MEREKIRQYLSKKLLVRFGDGPDDLTDATNLFESGVIDSFAFVQLVQFLEREFQVEITNDEAMSDALSTVASIAAFVAQKRAHAS